MAQSGSSEGHDYELKLDLGGEQILLEKVESVEGLSRPFETTLSIISEHTEIDLLPHLGKLAVVKVNRGAEDFKYLTGHVVSGELVKETPQGFHYRLMLAPSTYFMDQNRTYKTFHQKSARAILDTFASGNLKIDTSRLARAGQATREYIVQYAESDFNFIARLMEREGVYYFWEHSQDGHKMVLCDGPSSHTAGAKQELAYSPTSAAITQADVAGRIAEGHKNWIQGWSQASASVGQQRVTYKSLVPDAASTPAQASVSQGNKHSNDQGLVYHYHAGLDKDEFNDMAQQSATFTLNALRAQRVIFHGTGQMVGISAGSKIDVVRHPAQFMNGTFLVIRTIHSVAPERFRSGTDEDEAKPGVRFEAIPFVTPFNAPRNTPIPRIAGFDTAIVTSGADDTDKYGRVKVKFPWDVSPAPSRWCRVSQHGGMGNIVLPRINEEVLIGYLEGDPDFPVIVGHVFNSERVPAYPLPGDSYRAVWRNLSSNASGKGDSAAGQIEKPYMDGVNELAFDNKKGEEHILFHATRDLNTRVHNNEQHYVKKDQKIQVDGAREVKVKKNETVDVDGAILIEAKQSITLKVGGSKIVIKPSSISVEAMDIKIKGTMIEAAGAMTTVKADGVLTLKGGMVMIN